MDNNNVNYYFDRLKKVLDCPSLETLSNLYNDISSSKLFDKSLFDSSLYPELPPANAYDKDKLRKYIDNDTIRQDLLLNDIKDNPLAQILYAIVWKNGDLKKFNAILCGLNDDIDGVKNDSYVFFQFARHLIDRNLPIVDQHTIRAFLYYQYLNTDANSRILIFSKLFKGKKNLDLNNNESVINKIKRFNKARRIEFDSYIAWISDVLPKEIDDRESSLGILDKIMFTLGKHLSSA